METFDIYCCLVLCKNTNFKNFIECECISFKKLKFVHQNSLCQSLKSFTKFFIILNFHIK